jgi:hypothetical protein
MAICGRLIEEENAISAIEPSLTIKIDVRFSRTDPRDTPRRSCLAANILLLVHTSAPYPLRCRTNGDLASASSLLNDSCNRRIAEAELDRQLSVCSISFRISSDNVLISTSVVLSLLSPAFVRRTSEVVFPFLRTTVSVRTRIPRWNRTSLSLRLAWLFNFSHDLRREIKTNMEGIKLPTASSTRFDISYQDLPLLAFLAADRACSADLSASFFARVRSATVTRALDIRALMRSFSTTSSL